MNWQPMSCFPERLRDETRVMFWFMHGKYAVVLEWNADYRAWFKNADDTYDDPSWYDFELSHWCEITPPTTPPQEK